MIRKAPRRTSSHKKNRNSSQMAQPSSEASHSRRLESVCRQSQNPLQAKPASIKGPVETGT